MTFSQFSQCMSYLQLHISADETSIIKKRFGDSKGFNYISFLAEIQPSEKLEDKYQERMTQLVLQKTATLSTRERSSVNVEQVLDRMKSKVSSFNICLFMLRKCIVYLIIIASHWSVDSSTWRYLLTLYYEIFMQCYIFCI